MTEAELQRFAEALVVIARGATKRTRLPDNVEEALAVLVSLVERVSELEQRQKAMRYRGTWKAATMYSEGTFISFDGSLWHANSDTDSKPGADSTWTLAVKHGRDGKDASRFARTATRPVETHSRVNGQ